MTVEEIEDLAMITNALMPEKLSQPDQVLFQKFRYLHSLYRIGGISREQAAIEKQRFLVDHTKQVNRELFGRKQSDHTVAMWRDMEGHASTYMKSRKAIDTASLLPDVLTVIETGDKLVEAIDGKVTGWNQIGMEVEQNE